MMDQVAIHFQPLFTKAMSNKPTSSSLSLQTWEQAVAWLRSQPSQRELVLGAYFDDPLLDAAQRYWRSGEWEAIRGCMPQARGHALDVGAGRGIASFALAKDGFAVTALEPDPSDLVGAGAIRSLAREAGLDIDVAQEFSEKLPFADRSFDFVFARAVLHHTSDLRAACREFFRVLRPGGIFVAAREHVISKASDLSRFLDSHPLHRHYGGENAFLLSDYRGAIEASGMCLKSTFGPCDSPINYSPRSSGELRRELALRVTRGIAGSDAVLAAGLGLPGVWPVVSRLVSRLDGRPGRLFSFVAQRPS
jgi:SAM-dependent methyltransferase